MFVDSAKHEDEQRDDEHYNPRSVNELGSDEDAENDKSSDCPEEKTASAVFFVRRSCSACSVLRALPTNRRLSAVAILFSREYLQSIEVETRLIFSSPKDRDSARLK